VEFDNSTDYMYTVDTFYMHIWQ